MSDETIESVVADINRLIGNDFPRYAELFLRIEDKDGSLVPFRLNESQRIVWDKIRELLDADKPVRALILKGRQQGMSTLCQGLLVWRVMTGEGQKAMTVAQKLRPAAQELFGKAELMYENMPEAVRPPLAPGMSTGRRIKLGGNNRGVLVVESAEEHENVGRSGTYQLIHATEIPFWPKQQETMAALLNVCRPKPGTMVLVESTARGMGNWFHEQWVQAIRDVEAGRTPAFLPIFVPWFVEPDYAREPNSFDAPLTRREQERKQKYGLTDAQLMWYRDQSKVSGELMAQEFPDCWEEAFLSSGLPFFHAKDLAEHKKRMEREGWIRPRFTGNWEVRQDRGRLQVKLRKDSAGPLWIWDPPKDGHSYVVAVDPSTGRAKDYSTFQVLDVDTLEQVASFQGKTEPDDLAVLSILTARYYNNALWAPERNSVGYATVVKGVKDIGYPNVYRVVKEASVKEGESDEYGWITSPKTRPPMLESLAELVHTHRIKLKCIRTLEEMERFIFADDVGKKAEAAQGANDDLVMALAIATSVRGYAFAGEVEFEVVL